MSKLELVSNSPAGTREIAKCLAELLEGGDVIALKGELGAGKTEFVRGIAEFFEIDGVRSPSFTIINTLKGNSITIYHVDLYRVKNIEELFFAGFFDLLQDKESVKVIEWPEMVEEYLPEDVIKIFLEIAGESRRKITIETKKEKFVEGIRRCRENKNREAEDETSLSF